MARNHDKYWRYRVALAVAKADNDLTFEDIAVSLGVSERTVRRYYNDPGRMDLDIMQRLHRAIGLDAETVRSVLPVV